MQTVHRHLWHHFIYLFLANVVITKMYLYHQQNTSHPTRVASKVYANLCWCTEFVLCMMSLFEFCPWETSGFSFVSQAERKVADHVT